MKYGYVMFCDIKHLKLTNKYFLGAKVLAVCEVKTVTTVILKVHRPLWNNGVSFEGWINHTRAQLECEPKRRAAGLQGAEQQGGASHALELHNPVFSLLATTTHNENIEFVRQWAYKPTLVTSVDCFHTL